MYVSWVIVLAFFGLAFEVVVFFLGFLTYYWFFLHRNDITKCRVFLPNIEKPYKGKLLHMSSKGYVYNYNRGKETIVVPKTYEVIYHWHVRVLYLNEIGRLVASPTITDTPISPDEKHDLIHDLVNSKIGSEMILAMRGKSQAGLFIVIVVAIFMALIAGVIGYSIHKPTVPITATTNITQPAPVQKSGSGQIK